MNLKDQVNSLIKRIDGHHFYSERNALVLKEVAHELQSMILELVKDDPYKWDGIYNKVFHTESHINNLSHKTKKWKLDGYKYGYEQTLDDLKELRDVLS